jgi:hypothetical protein
MTNLTPNPVLEEIRRLNENLANGVLSLKSGGGERVEIFFREGMIESAYSSADGRRLGDYLQKDGYATARELDAVEPVARRAKIFMGEAVVRKGTLASRPKWEVLYAGRPSSFSITSSLTAFP